MCTTFWHIGFFPNRRDQTLHAYSNQGLMYIVNSLISIFLNSNTTPLTRSYTDGHFPVKGTLHRYTVCAFIPATVNWSMVVAQDALSLCIAQLNEFFSYTSAVHNDDVTVDC